VNLTPGEHPPTQEAGSLWPVATTTPSSALALAMTARHVLRTLLRPGGPPQLGRLGLHGLRLLLLALVEHGGAPHHPCLVHPCLPHPVCLLVCLFSSSLVHLTRPATEPCPLCPWP
jgi:hypothetical protein